MSGERPASDTGRTGSTRPPGNATSPACCRMWPARSSKSTQGLQQVRKAATSRHSATLQAQTKVQARTYRSATFSSGASTAPCPFGLSRAVHGSTDRPEPCAAASTSASRERIKASVRGVKGLDGSKRAWVTGGSGLGRMAKGAGFGGSGSGDASDRSNFEGWMKVARRVDERRAGREPWCQSAARHG
jgi:hypothetical protein